MSLAGPVAALWSWTSAPFRACSRRGYPSPFSALLNDGELLDLIALDLVGASSAKLWLVRWNQ
jgi:hypothetical protein